MKKYFVFTFLFGLSITISCQNNINRGYRVSVGDPSPRIELTLLDGTEITNENLKGKVVVIQFTASWCSVCIKEMPHLEKDVWQRFKGDDFILIGIDLKEELEVVKDFIEKTKVSYPFAIDDDGSFFKSFTLPKAGVTRNIVLDKNGDISFLTRLYDKQEFSEMVSHIDILLK